MASSESGIHAGSDLVSITPAKQERETSMNKGHHQLLPILPTFLIVFIVQQFVLAQSTPDFSLGKQLVQDEKYLEAKGVFTAIFNTDKSNDSAAFYLGRICQSQGDLDKSIQWFRKAIAINDSSSEYYHQLGLACGSRAQSASWRKKAGLAKDMRKHIEKAVELDSANIEARFSLIHIYLNMPRILGGGKAKARLQAEEIGKRDVKNGHIALATVYESEKKYELAENELRMLIVEGPTDSENYHRLGTFYSRIKKYERAISVLESAIEIDPKKMDAYYQIGKVGALSGRFLEKAEASMEYFLEHSENQDKNDIIWANYRLAMIYEKRKKVDKAKTAYKTALALDPKMKPAKEALKKLE